MSGTGTSCSNYDVRDYFLGELPEAERLQAGRHIQGCDHCGAEFEQLQLMRSALVTVRDEDPPQRIGFVSDKVFEPSPVRRWFGSFWTSGARLGFASAAVLAVALIFNALHQPAPVRVIEKQTVAAASPDIAPIVDRAVARAVAETEARQEKKTRDLLAAAEQKHEMDQRSLMLRVEASYDMLQKRYLVQRASALDYGSSQQ